MNNITVERSHGNDLSGLFRVFYIVAFFLVLFVLSAMQEYLIGSALLVGLGYFFLFINSPLFLAAAAFLSQTVMQPLLQMIGIRQGVTLAVFAPAVGLFLLTYLMRKGRPFSKTLRMMFFGLALMVGMCFLWKYIGSANPIASSFEFFFLRAYLRYSCIYAFMMFFTAIVCDVSTRHIRWFFYLYFILSMINGLFALVEYRFIPGWVPFLSSQGISLTGFEGFYDMHAGKVELSRHRSFGLMASPHSVSATACFIFSYGVLLLGYARKFRWIPVALGMILFAFAVMFVSGQRTAMIGFFAVLLVAMLRTGRFLRYLRWAVPMLLLLIVAFFVFKYAANEIYTVRGSAWVTFLESFEKDKIVASRIAGWESALREIFEKPFGHGLGYSRSRIITNFVFGNAESTFLSLSLDGGLFMLAGFFLVLLGILFELLSLRKRSRENPAIHSSYHMYTSLSECMFAVMVVFHLAFPLIALNEPHIYLLFGTFIPMWLVRRQVIDAATVMEEEGKPDPAVHSTVRSMRYF